MKMGQKLAKLHISIYLSLCREDARSLLEQGRDVDELITVINFPFCMWQLFSKVIRLANFFWKMVVM